MATEELVILILIAFRHHMWSACHAVEAGCRPAYAAEELKLH
jgi:hypothetical protein